MTYNVFSGTINPAQFPIYTDYRVYFASNIHNMSCYYLKQNTARNKNMRHISSHARCLSKV